VSDLASATAAPETTNNTTSYRALKAVVIFLGALIVVAFAILVIGLVMRFSSKAHPRATGDESSIELPAGTTIVSSDVQGDRLILRTKSATGDEVYIVDTANGHLVGHVVTAPPKVR